MQLNFLTREKINEDQSKVKPYFTMAQQPSSDTLPLRCSTFLLLSPLTSPIVD
jgi:hypothetical protein